MQGPGSVVTPGIELLSGNSSFPALRPARHDLSGAISEAARSAGPSSGHRRTKVCAGLVMRPCFRCRPEPARQPERRSSGGRRGPTMFLPRLKHDNQWPDAPACCSHTPQRLLLLSFKHRRATSHGKTLSSRNMKAAPSRTSPQLPSRKCRRRPRGRRRDGAVPSRPGRATKTAEGIPPARNFRQTRLTLP